MAQLKDTWITGGLRVTDTTITDILLTSAIKAPVDSASGTIGVGSSGLVLTSDGTNTYWSSDVLAANDAMVFKGTLGTGGTVTSVPTNGYSAGWTYRVITAGVYAGEYCELGDLLIAINDGPATGSSIIAADWTRAQTNIDGPVFRKKNDNNSPDTFTTNRLIYSTSSGGEVASANNLYYDGTSLILQNDLNLYTNDNDRYINFTYYNNTAESIARWRLGYKGSGTGDDNAFYLLSTGSSSTLGSKTEFSDVLSITMNTHRITASNSLTIKGGTVGSTAQSNGLWIYNPGDTSVKYASLYTNNTGTTSAIGVAVLSLGNATAENSNNNARGRAVIYGIKGAATRLESAITGSTSYTMYLPDYAGDGYLVHTSGTTKVGDTTLPVYIAANGRVTAITGAIANSTTGSAAKLSNTAKIGDTNNPVYFTANGVPSAISYTIDANISSATAKSVALYTSATTIGETTGKMHVNTATKSGSTKVYEELVIGNLADYFGRIVLYGSANVAGGAYIFTKQSASGWTNHVLPSTNGWLVTGGNGTDTGVGSSIRSIYISTSGVATLCDYDIDTINVTARGTTKAYLLADTTSPTSNHHATAVAESDVYLDTTAGKLAATIFKLAEKAEIQYNTTTNAIDFNFI